MAVAVGVGVFGHVAVLGGGSRCRRRRGEMSHRAQRLVAVRCSQAEDGSASSSPPGQQQVTVEYNPIGRMAEAANDAREKRTSITLFSPSKINLFLRITRRRPDGYHDLASLFHAIDLGDALKFSVSPSTRRDSLTTNASGVPLDDTNLINRALALFRKHTGSQQYYWVHLDKRVPTGAGLGGGSGNAATALWAANEMCGRPASTQDLAEWAAEIGSDISFFFSKGAAYCTGRGEIVEDVPPPLPLDMRLCLVKPSEECSTAEIFKTFNIDEASKVDGKELLERIVSERRIRPETCINDLEAPAFRALPRLKALKQRLVAAGRGRYDAVFMTGSGSTIVLVGDDEPPPFIYDEPEYEDVFLSGKRPDACARLLTRSEDQWYSPVGAGSFADEDPFAAQPEMAPPSGVDQLESLKLPFSFES
eukprot:jgi/Chlat1/850/Chrsp104S01191